jgi:MYXO-CTERM domain-containing protein
MRSSRSVTLVLRASVACATLGAGTQAVLADGLPPNTWRRSSDWVNGDIQGSTSGNPGNVGGVPIWQYEWTTGGALNSENPWFKNAGNLLSWDTGWWNTGWQVWSKGDDDSPPILQGRLIHNVAAASFDNIPLVRWLNPMAGTNAVNITGTLLVNWNGVDGLGRPDDVDVVIGEYSAVTHTTSILYSTTVSKPTPFPSVGDSVLLPINLLNVTVNAGDSIVVTHRGQTPLFPLGGWVNLFDGVTIQQVPAPGAAGLLALAGLAAARRRRR